MTPTLCEQIKARISLRGVGALLGIDLPQKDSVKFRSPLRPDRHPSCSIRRDLFTDWASGHHLDQIDFFAMAKGIPRHEGIKKLAEILRLVGEAPARPLQTSDASSCDAAERAKKRSRWPIFETPSKDEIRRIAELRGLSPESVSLAAQRGLVFCADSREGRTWIVSDSARRNAQARRMDGQKWNTIGEKAWTLPGAEASLPVGLPEASSFPAIALCEGGPDMLAAFHLAWCDGVDDRVAPVGMLGAGHRIPTESLPLFAGRRVRIFGHRDERGQEAAERWAEQLAGVGCRLDGFLFDGLQRMDGLPVGDLNEFCHIAPDQWERERDRVETAFNFATPQATGTANRYL